MDDITRESSALRRLLLALIVATALGLCVDLVLIEHVEPGWQQAPLIGLVSGLGSTILFVLRPTRTSLRLFRMVMAAFLILGALGVYLHVEANAQLEREMDPDARGTSLLWIALRGGVPAGAPAAMTQLGLLGLIFGYRHPASGSTDAQRG